MDGIIQGGTTRTVIYPHNMCRLEIFYNIPMAKGNICCDNYGVLYKSGDYRRIIPTGAAEADIKRLLRNIKKDMKSTFDYP